ASDGDSQATLSSLGLLRRIWQYCRSRPGAVAALLAACGVETAFYWLVPLSFRSLIDGALTARDRHHLVVVLVVLIAGASAALFASLQRGRLWAHLQSQIASDMRFQVFTKIQALSPERLTAGSSAAVLTRFSHDIGTLE